jgi:2-succinyl-5-enolpyruvyl-6-hydroxy-3-cyclohexene-1-carboxylate synthase
MGITSDKEIVRQVVGQCVANGLKHVVCSPGSRNAPFVIAFDEHPEVKCYVVHDERSAGFFALGMAQQLNEPVAVLCTSGSATVNYFPAVSEAYYQCVPLVVITADRPFEWVDQGDGQTIVQRDIFGKHVRYSCDFSERMTDEDGVWYINRELATAFDLGNGVWKGPFHINIGLKEPLYGTEELIDVTVRRISTERGRFTLSNTQKQRLERQLSGTKKLILVGQHRPDDALLHQLAAFSDDSSVAVLVENTSNQQHDRFVHCIDRALNSITPEELAEFAPDILITVGGAIVSKRIKAFLRNNKPVEHWKVGYEFPYMDTYQSLTHSWQCDAADFFRELNGLHFHRNQNSFGAKWRQKDLISKDKLPDFFKTVEHSDISVFEAVLGTLPNGVHLHMSNSSVIRYCQLFDPIRTVRYWSNRGTSGIDGSTSTAVGAAVSTGDQAHVLITGDISFFYDSNALWNRYLPSNLRIILINNNGGGIFRIIPGPSGTKQGKEYFEAYHEQNAEKICQAFNVRYIKADSRSNMDDILTELYVADPSGRPVLLEIFTPREVNDRELDNFFKALR